MSALNIYHLFDKREETPPPEPAGPPRRPADGIHPYAAAIRQAWLDRLASLAAKPWQHGDAWDHNSFITARKLTELANSPWAGYSHTQAHADYLTHAPHNGAWDERQKCWEQGVEYAGSDLLPEPPPGEEIPDTTLLLSDTQGGPALTRNEEEEFWSARPLLAHLRTFAQARMASPWAVLGAALARIVAATPYTVHLPPIVGSRGSINLFVGLVGPSGAGKGAAEGVATEALRTKHIHAVRIASGEAITHVYKYKEKGEHHWRDSDHSALISVGEIDRLTGQSNRQGSTIMADLRSAWAGELLGQVAADTSRSMPLEAHEYRLSLIAGIQPHRASVLLDDADGGTPQRFLWLPVTDPDSPDDPPEAPEPLEWRAPATGPFVGIGGIQVTVCQAAQDEIRQARKATLRGQGDPLDGHALQCQLKTAAALGIADGRYTVTDQDWHLASVIQRKSSDTRTAVVAALAARREKESLARAEAEADRATVVEERQERAAIGRVLRKVLDKIGDGDGVPRTDLRRAVTSSDRKHFDAAIEQLVDSGQVEVREVKTDAGRTSRIVSKRL